MGQEQCERIQTSTQVERLQKTEVCSLRKAPEQQRLKQNCSEVLFNGSQVSSCPVSSLKERETKASAFITDLFGELGKKGMQRSQPQKHWKVFNLIKTAFMHDQSPVIERVWQLQSEYPDRKQRINPKLEVFLEEVAYSNLQLLDMLTYSRPKAEANYLSEISNHIVDLSASIKEETAYEATKLVGLELIRRQKVCFLVLAGGRNTRFGSCKQAFPLDIPSQKSILEIILHRYNALAQLLSCVISYGLVISSQKVDAILELFERNNFRNKKLQEYIYSQQDMGILDADHHLVLEAEGNVSLWPTGSGDILDFLCAEETGLPTIYSLIQNGFQYIQIIGTSNILEKCFDCFMLGSMEERKLHWATKVVPSTSQQDPKIYLNTNHQIYVCDPQQQHYPSESSLGFIDCTIYRLQFLRDLFCSAVWPQMRVWRKKTHKSCLIEPDTAKQQCAVSYEKDHTDILTASSSNPSTRYMLLKCERESSYAPLHFKEDLEGCAESLSNLHKCYLGISGISDKSQRCQIDPYVSLEGESLEKLRVQVRESYESELDSIYITLD